MQYFSMYMREAGYPNSVVESFKSHWKTTVKDEVLKRAGSVYTETRLVVPECELAIMHEGKDVRVFSRNEGIYIASQAPDFRDWRNVKISNSVVRDLIEDFFHFLTQYIQRSNIIPALVYLAYEYDLKVDWVYSHDVSQNRLEPSYTEGVLNSRLSHFLKQIDGHQPRLHAACFHYVRAKSLLVDGYEQEAIVHVESISSLLKQRAIELGGSPTNLEVIGINTEQEKMMKSLNRLRSNFSAHPNETKWWDFRELFDEEIDRYDQLAISMLLKLASSYKDNRPLYSYNFISNAGEAFFDAFWFNKVMKLRRS